MDKESLKEEYIRLKDNLSIILLVPTLLGGVWQLLELSSISTSFIRFLSLGQLVADGILILFVFTLFYASFRMVSSSFHKKSFIVDSKKTSSIAVEIALIVLTSIAFIFVVLPVLNEIYETRKVGIIDIVILIPIVTMVFGGFLLGSISIIENLLNKRNEPIEKGLRYKWIKSILGFTLKLFMIILFFAILKFVLVDLNPHLSSFRHSILSPENLLNKELLDKKLIEEHHLKQKPTLLYNNDKYLFYEILDEKKNKKILIVDFAAFIYK